jgi:hypothetical protein
MGELQKDGVPGCPEVVHSALLTGARERLTRRMEKGGLLRCLTRGCEDGIVRQELQSERR